MKLYRHFDKEGRLLYVGICRDEARRLKQHKTESHWYKDIHRIAYEDFDSRRDVIRAERIAIREEGPLYNHPMTGGVATFSDKRAKDQKPEDWERIIATQLEFEAKMGICEGHASFNKLLREECKKEGAMVNWARKHRISQCYVGDVLRGIRKPGPSIVEAMQDSLGRELKFVPVPRRDAPRARKTAQKDPFAGMKFEDI